MSFIQWSESFAVGHDEIDRQHRKLVGMIARLQQSLSQGLVNPQIGIALKELVQYAKTHFRDEQKIMRDIAYPEYDAHVKLHEELTAQIIVILTNLKQDKPVTAVDLIDFMKWWLVEHILEEDKKIGVYIREKTKAGLTVS